MNITCRNCGHAFQGEYCNLCGQKAFKRLTPSYLWLRLSQDLLDVDRGLLLTFKELWVHPGIMVLNYIHGKSKQYYSPLKYLIFWSALDLLVVTFKYDVPWNFLKGLIVNSNAPFSAKSFDDLKTLLFAIVTTHRNIFFLGILPFLSCVNYLFHRTHGFNFVEILVLHAYFFGQYASALIVLTILDPWLNSITFFGHPLTYLLSGLPYFYLFIKIQKEFFSETWRVAIFKGLFIWALGNLAFLMFLFIFFNGIKYAL